MQNAIKTQAKVFFIEFSRSKVKTFQTCACTDSAKSRPGADPIRV